MKTVLAVMFIIAGMSSVMAQQGGQTLPATVSNLLRLGFTPVAGSSTGGYGGLFLTKGHVMFMCNVYLNGSNWCVLVQSPLDARN
jgi:hypothetical protein